MKTKNTDRINKTLGSQLEKYRNRIAELPFTNERSRLVDLVTCLLEEGTDNGQKRNIE